MTGSRTPTDLRWWLKDGAELADTVCHVVRRIRADQEYRKQDDLLHASLYGNVQLLGLGAYTYSRPETRGGQLSLNVVRNMISAATSRIAAKAKPKPLFMTKGGSWELRRKAKKLEKVIEGTFAARHIEFYDIANTVFRDGGVFGTGLTTWGVDTRAKRVFCERLLPGELVVDDAEAIYGQQSVRSFYRLKFYDKLVLAELYPEHEATIMAAKVADGEEMELGFDPTCEQVLVREAWRLPAYPGAKDGRWARVILGAVLDDAPYKRDYAPFAAWRWEKPLAGWFGDGLAFELRGIQLEINDLLDEIQDLQHSIKGKWLVEQASQVNENELNDEGDAILRYRGVAPVYAAPGIIVPPELYQHLQYLVGKAYEVAGISQLAATSQKPGGITSGAGLRAYRDQQSERFLEKFESWDKFILDNARLGLDALRDLAERDGDLVITTRRGTAIDTLKFKEIDIEEHAYELQMMPTSMIPSTPAGKLALAEDLTKIGLADAEEMLELIDLPDTERLTKRKLATRQLVEDMLEGMVETGVYQPPEPFMFWPTALKVSVESFLEYRRDQCPPHLLDLVSRWIVQARLLMKKEIAENAPPPPPPGPGPMGPMGAPPMGGPPPGPPMPPPMGP